ncbi:MAG: hypothetical protein KC656_09900 [Myxococcales bacterium]|nr:hypothetical protein [Myxococcales bacterium]
MRAVVLLLLASACKAPLEPIEEPLDALLEHGPYSAGYTEQSVTYDPGDGPREIRLAVWYPSDAPELPGFRYDGIWPAGEVAVDGAVAAGAFPLAIYSHGHQGYAEASSNILARAVSHGMVVVAPEHLGNTTFSGDRTTDIYWKRPADISATLDHVLSTDFPLAASLSDAPILGLGHSFGGYTMEAVTGATYATTTLFPACAAGEDSPFCSTMTPDQEARFVAGFHDDRVAALLAMAPGDFRLFETSGLGAIGVPVFLLTGGLDDVQQGDLQWSGLDRQGDFRAHLEDYGHLAFTDFAPDGLPDVYPETAWSVLGAWVVAFQRHIVGDVSVEPLFSGEDPPFGSSTTLVIGGR